MKRTRDIPSKSYGILQQYSSNTVIDEAVEQVKNLGYAVINSGYELTQLQSISNEFNQTRDKYIKQYGESKLRSLNELYTMRSPLTYGGNEFLKLALNKNLLLTLEKLIPGQFILNQQNGLINPVQETYSQVEWHRDLPYQHFISSSPIAINAIFCVDDFTIENGATFVLPASHKVEAFPSPNFVQRNAHQIEAEAGSFLLLDCMVFHVGGFNSTESERRAVNHVYNIPYFKQQVNIPLNLKNKNISEKEREILGFNNMEPSSISNYLSTRSNI